LRGKVLHQKRVKNHPTIMKPIWQKFIMANNRSFIMLACALMFQPIIYIEAQITSFKMGDTLFLKPHDEFLDVRLSKFSTEKIGERPFYRTLVYYEGKPFTGTIVKNKGLSQGGREIIGSFANYSENEDDQTYFSVSYQNGRFSGWYMEENECADIRLWFDKDGNPDKSGMVIIKKTEAFELDHVPVTNPKFLRLSERFSNGNCLINFYDERNLGVFNYRDNSESVLLLPLGVQSLNELIYKYAIIDPELNNCKLLDTIHYKFSKNHLLDFSYKDECGYKIVFEKSTMINEMPVFDAATNDGNHFINIDYSNLLFSDYYSDELSGSRFYYIKSILSSENGYFFNTLDKLPEWAKVTTNDYFFEIHFDIEKAKREAEQISLKDYFSTEKLNVPYRDPIYKIALPAKSFDLICNIKINNSYTKHIKSKYLVSTDGNYDLNSEYWYDGDTVIITTSGNLKNKILKKFELHINPNTEPANGEMRWLKIEYIGNDKYIIEAAGRLGRDDVKNAQITSYQILAKSINQQGSDSNFLSLKPDGTTTFKYEDGTQKQYKYKNGELIID